MLIVLTPRSTLGLRYMESGEASSDIGVTRVKGVKEVSTSKNPFP